MDSITDNALNGAAIASEEDKLVERVQNIFGHLRKTESLDVNSPSQFEDLMTEAVSYSDRYQMKDTSIDEGDVVYEIENTSHELTDVITLSYDEEGQMYASLSVEE